MLTIVASNATMTAETEIPDIAKKSCLREAGSGNVVGLGLGLGLGIGVRAVCESNMLKRGS